MKLPFAIFCTASAIAQLPPATFRQYCFSCHGENKPAANLSIRQLTSHNAVGEQYQHWQKVATALEEKHMPPAKMPQPSEAERTAAVKWIRARLGDYARQHAGDPGKVTVRRLTSAEYAYAVQDLTGVDIRFDGDFVADSVGGEGFTNFGDVQFLDNANLERYLDASKHIAKHAVIGTGPLQFFGDPGKSGLELSAINRIQKIYEANGFRTASAEGGLPYGLDAYSKAVFASWQFQHRAALGEPNAKLEDFARREKVSARFAQHIWTVLNDSAAGYPTTEVIALFKKLPPPSGDRAKAVAAAKAGAMGVQNFMIDWPRFLLGAGPRAQGGQGDERALILTEESVEATESYKFRFLARGGRGVKKTNVVLSAVSANPVSKDQAMVHWKNAVVRFRKADRSAGTQEPLLAAMSKESRAKLTLPPAGATYDFATPAGSSVAVEIAMPDGVFGMEVSADAELAPGGVGDAVVRATISETADLAKGRPSSALLARPKTEAFKAWKAGVLRFAVAMPQASQGEPTPADRDPIPPPFENAYNQPERDWYHTRIKYYRDDKFVVDKMLDDATRKKLDEAWMDLYSSFEYHDALFGFVARKYKLDAYKDKGVDDLTYAQIDSLANEPRKYVEKWRAEYDAIQKAQQAAKAGHVADCLKLAAKAWRRPLTETEKQNLRAFYNTMKDDHSKAIRALLARILVSPQFLYRVEAQTAAQKPLNNWELASRLSFFLWSSVPDAELARAAAAGELADPRGLEKQAKRMLADPKARRFATEFFGQWLGFYRFDQYRGADATKFPEFTDEVKAGMYDEAVSFFEYVVRNDRPVREIYSADYTFLNTPLAKHYGVKKEFNGTERVTGANAFQRGGMFRLGAVLTATSAPLRTSPVKRGDWVLRRILGTPTPPPPADAGSIPADEKQFGGLSLKARLESHKRNATCANCHMRIDPLGFPFERYDAVGRWRDKYSDGKPVEDNATALDRTEIAGIDGLLKYVQKQEPQVLRTLSQKLVGFALGRTALLSDQPLIDNMTKGGGETSFSRMVADIVSSRQFRNRRAQEATQTASAKSQGGNAQ